MARRTPHQKIRDAYMRGTGLHLTAKDVDALAMDDAIMRAAENDDVSPEEKDADSEAELRSRYPDLYDPEKRRAATPAPDAGKED